MYAQFLQRYNFFAHEASFPAEKQVPAAVFTTKSGIVFAKSAVLRIFVARMSPLISFIIAYHNEPPDLLRACLESIMALPLAAEEREVVVVDDGSESCPLPFVSDPTAGGDSGVRLVRQEASGLSVARNTGISRTSGKYIQFVDADDCLLPDYRAVLQLLREGSADLVMFRMSTKPSSPPHAPCPSPLAPKLQSGPSFLQHRNMRAAACGYAFRRDVLGELRFRPGLLHEDELFTPQLLLQAGKLCDLPLRAYFYRQHPGTITHAASPEKIRKRLDDIHFILNELRDFRNPLLERRIHQLTVDYMQKVWTLTHSLREFRHRSRQLRSEGFLPLPIRPYSLRHLFACLLLPLCSRK